MTSRRSFLKLTGIVGLSLHFAPKLIAKNKLKKSPIMVSTWSHGLDANKIGFPLLNSGKPAIEAIEKGANIVESDPNVRTVGVGGRPDASGKVTLDACIMDYDASCGAVMCLEDIENPISVARLVKDKTPHVILSGLGAKEFALENGFSEVSLLTEKSKLEWEAWVQDSNYKAKANIENHDTIGLLAMDKKGNLSGGCTTSGMAFKMPGRVGDSPVIGSGLYVDNEIGACTATGEGEAIIRASGSFLVVSFMKQGYSPQIACEKAIKQVMKLHPNRTDLQVGFLALSTSGEVGACSLKPGFNYAVHDGKENKLLVAKSLML